MIYIFAREGEAATKPDVTYSGVAKVKGPVLKTETRGLRSGTQPMAEPGVERPSAAERTFRKVGTAFVSTRICGLRVFIPTPQSRPSAQPASRIWDTGRLPIQGTGRWADRPRHHAREHVRTAHAFNPRGAEDPRGMMENASGEAGGGC